MIIRKAALRVQRWLLRTCSSELARHRRVLVYRHSIHPASSLEDTNFPFCCQGKIKKKKTKKNGRPLDISSLGLFNSLLGLERSPPSEHSFDSGVSRRSTHWGGREEQAGKVLPLLLPLEHTLRSSSPSSGFGQLPELFPRVVSSLACRQVWMFCQHSREFMIACRCVSKNTLYPKQKLMQA